MFEFYCKMNLLISSEDQLMDRFLYRYLDILTVYFSSKGHTNYLYNKAFWTLVIEKKLKTSEAREYLLVRKLYVLIFKITGWLHLKYIGHRLF